MRAEPRRPVRLRMGPLPLVGAVILDFAAFLALPLQAQAVTTLVSNVGQASEGDGSLIQLTKHSHSPRVATGRLP